MKKLVSLIVGLALCLGLTSFAFAEGPAPVASEIVRNASEQFHDGTDGKPGR